MAYSLNRSYNRNDRRLKTCTFHADVGCYFGADAGVDSRIVAC